eukprot:803832-Alexandrium_andersonii.AAC.1
MSASLVGSEMCIRDRTGDQQQTTHLQCGVWALQACISCPQHPSKRRREPVSYTHLTLPTICSV